MEKKKILFEGVSQNVGGIERFVHDVYTNLDKEKYEISFLVDGKTKIAYYDEYQKDGCKIFYTENRKKNYFRYLKDLKKIYTNNHFDIIHINVMSYSLFERITYACKYSKSNTIVHSHSTGYAKGYFKTRLLHTIGKLFIKNKKFNKIACGENAGRFMFGQDKYKVIKNGIDIDKFKFSNESRMKERAMLNIPEMTSVMCHVGTFYPVKNHTFLIDVFDEYVKLYNNSKLLLIGEGFLESQIRDKVKNKNLDDKVLFLGKRDDVNDILSASDVFVMPSISEGLSMSLCEAQVNGLKCYTSSSVDKSSDISGNVSFLDIDKGAMYWAKSIFNNLNRDEFVLSKIPEEMKVSNSCKELIQYYNEIMNQKG